MPRRHDYLRVGWENFGKEKLTNETGSPERLVYAPLFHRFEAFRRDVHGDFPVEFGDKNGLFLKVDLAAAGTGRGEFCRARAVRISASDAALFACDNAISSHSPRILRYFILKSKEKGG